ncbi:MAG TPA: glycosyltransferase [Solirubrobacteraceae bacterium]|jgi:glycosyltransferase involved in cell wall biosynthesis
MRVALVAPLVSAIREPQRGGSQAFISDLARGLVVRGHDVELYCASGSEVPGVRVIETDVDPDALAASLYRASGPAPERGLAPAEAAFASVYSIVRRADYDLVHNHAFDAPAIALAESVPAPIVHTLHLPPEPAVARALQAALHADRPPTVATVSNAQARAWRRVVAVDAILPPLVPTGEIPWSASPGDGAVFAGRLSPEKGALEAIEIARAAGVAIELYGDPYDPEYARERIEPRRDDPGVDVRPGVPRTEIWEVMARAAVLLFPAMWEEPFGMAAAEAQACGTPVVAFRSGALGEVILDGVTGFLVTPGDLGAAAQAVHSAASLLRSRCREHAERDLDLALSLDAHERLYERVVRGRVEVATGG